MNSALVSTTLYLLRLGTGDQAYLRVDSHEGLSQVEGMMLSFALRKLEDRDSF